MKYYCLLKIPVPDYDHYIEVGSEFDLPFHPNLTDEIEILGYPSKIEEIYYTLEDIHNGKYATIKMIAVDCLNHAKSEEDARKLLNEIWQELHEWDSDIILNDWTVNPTV